MTIELYYSNQLSVLFECLNINMQSSYRHFKDPFEADKIIVLNSHTQKWLQLNLAAKNGVMANIEFLYLEGVLWKLLEQLDNSNLQAETLDKEMLRVVLYEFFLTKSHPDLEIFEKYLKSSATEKLKWSRTWMLAEKIASLLSEYEYQRPDMIEAWINNKLYLEPKHQEIEKAQKYLYLELLHPTTGLLQKRKTPVLTLYQYASKVFLKPLKKNISSKPIHMFAISQVSVFHQKLLAKLKDHFDFHIYAFNPCRELWEDIKTPREEHQFPKINFEKTLKLSNKEIDDGEIDFEEKDNFLLKNWGKTGREYIKLMSGLVDYNFFPGYVDNNIEVEKETVLQRVKRHIFNRTSSNKEIKIKQDKSIQIFNAPSILREVQTIFHNILKNIKSNPQLKLHEIVVLVPNMDLYRSCIVSVFEGSSIGLKYGISDNTAISDSIWGKGLLSILDIAKGMMTRTEVFEYLSNPCAMSRFDYNENHLEKWTSWVEKLGIFHHFSEKDKQKAGFPQTMFFTWKQGLQRLRMGRLFATNNLNANQGYPFFIPESIDGDIGELDKFILIIEKLSDTVEVLKKDHTAQEWISLINIVSNDFLKVPQDLIEENRYLPNIKRNLDALYEFEVVAKELKSKPHLDLDMIYEFIVSSLAMTESVKGSFLNGGVVISKLQPMRPFPFKITYVLGLGGTEFPGRDIIFPLDLRSFKRKIGDISNSDRNRYLFLENFLSTSEKIILSWVNKNLVNDEELVSSSIVLQLKRYLEEEVIELEGDNKEFKVFSMPLQSFDIPKNPKENNNFTDLYYSFELIDHVNAHLQKESIKEDAIIAINSKAKDFFLKYDTVLVETKPEVENEIKRIKVRDLESYLQFASYAYMGYQLKIDESLYDENDPIDEFLEPLSLDFLQLYQLKSLFTFQYFDTCKKEGNVKDFLKFVEDNLPPILETLSKKCGSGEGAFNKYMNSNLKRMIISSREYYEFVAEQIIDAEHFFHGVSIGSKVDSEIKKTLFAFISPSIEIKIDKLSVFVSADIKNCWVKNKQLFCAIDKDSKKMVKTNFNDLLKVLFVYAFSVNDFIAVCDRLNIICNNNGSILSSANRQEVKDYFFMLINDFFKAENQIFMPGELFEKVKDLDTTDAQNVVKYKFENNPKNEYKMKMPDYLTLGKFDIPNDIKDLYLKRFAFTKFFQEIGK